MQISNSFEMVKKSPTILSQFSKSPAFEAGDRSDCNKSDPMNSNFEVGWSLHDVPLPWRLYFLQLVDVPSREGHPVQNHRYKMNG